MALKNEISAIPRPDIDPVKQAQFRDLVKQAETMLVNGEAQGALLFACDKSEEETELVFVNHSGMRTIQAIGNAIGETMGNSPLAAIPLMSGINDGMAKAKKARETAASPNTNHDAAGDDDIDNLIHN